MVLDQRLGNDHEHGSRYAFPGYVGNHHGQVSLVDHEEIVEIAAYCLGRGHRRINVEVVVFRECREDIRQHVGLNAAGEIELGCDLLAFSGLGLLGEDGQTSSSGDLHADGGDHPVHQQLRQIGSLHVDRPAGSIIGSRRVQDSILQ